jgi:hypothetical protein
MSDLKTFLLKNKDINGEYNVVLKTYDWKVKNTNILISNKEWLDSFLKRNGWWLKMK